MQAWRKKFQAEYWSSDIKPSKHDRVYRKCTGSWRKQGQEEIRKELAEMEADTAESGVENEFYEPVVRTSDI